MIVDLCAGPGGWSEALRMLGLGDVGIEWDDAACRTRAAAGHLTIRADIAQYPPEVFAGKVIGLIASPPCQDWSDSNRKNPAAIDGAGGALVREVPRWVEAIRPTWVVCEQVPPVLEVWLEYAARFEILGYRATAAVLNAADYGVPQARRRAILVARRDDGRLLPDPTHQRDPAGTLFPLRPWVTMAEALEGLGPYSVRWEDTGPYAESVDLPTWCKERPATTVTSAGRVPRPGWREHDERQFGAETVRLTVAQAARLQSFPDDYPFQAPHVHEQIGNAVPPLFAAHLLGTLIGASLEVAA